MSEPPDRYHPVATKRWRVLAVIVLLHFGLFYLAVALNIVPLAKLPDVPMVVDLIPVAEPPPSVAAKEPVERRLVPTPPELPRITAPAPIVQVLASPVIVALPQPPQPAPPALPAPAVVATPATVTVDDLGARLVSAKPPTYPIESRRKREQGVVVLRVTVGEQGRVEAITIERSSGHDRLDQAALTAVRNWHWSPTMVDGAAVRVRGLVRIPFELIAR